MVLSSSLVCFALAILFSPVLCDSGLSVLFCIALLYSAVFSCVRSRSLFVKLDFVLFDSVGLYGLVVLSVLSVVLAISILLGCVFVCPVWLVSG